MIKILSIVAIVGGLSAASVVEASARTRNVTVYGPHGVSQRSVSRTCAGGVCARSAVTTGPYGRTVARSGSASCYAGVCSGSGMVTGPRGSVSYYGTYVR